MPNPYNRWLDPTTTPIDQNWYRNLGAYTDPLSSQSQYFSMQTPDFQAMHTLNAMGLGAGGVNPFYNFLRDQADLLGAQYRLSSMGVQGAPSQANWLANAYQYGLRGNAPAYTGAAELQGQLQNRLAALATGDQGLFQGTGAAASGARPQDQMNMAFAGLQGQYAPWYRRVLQDRLQNELNMYLHDSQAGATGNDSFLRYLGRRGWLGAQVQNQIVSGTGTGTGGSSGPGIAGSGGIPDYTQ